MQEKRGKKRKTDAQTAYIRSEIKELKKRWANIIGSDDSQNADAGVSCPGSSESGSAGNAANNSSSSASGSSESWVQTSSGDESGSTDISGQNDENDSRRMPSFLNFPDEMFDFTADPEEVLDGCEPILDESVVPGSETYNVPSVEHDADEEAISSLIQRPAEHNSLGIGEKEFIISSNNLKYFSDSAPSRDEFPELETSIEALRDFSQDTYRKNSLNFEFNPTAFSSPIPERLGCLLKNVAERKGGYEFRTEPGSLRGNEALLYSKPIFGINDQNPAPSTSSAIDFSVYPTPNDMTPASEAKSDQRNIAAPVFRIHAQPAASSSRDLARSKKYEAIKPKATSQQKRKPKARSVKKRKTKKSKPSVKTMARALPKELERRQQRKKVRYTCETCLKTFSTRGQLQYHVHNSHKSFELVCKMCHKTDFGNQRILILHMKTCELEVKSFVCQTCEDQFEDNVQLTLHSSIHEPPKRFVCETCSSDFEDEASLKKHFQSVHQKSERFQCHACDQNYATKYGLARHIRKKHPRN